MPYEIKGVTFFLTQKDASILHWLGWFEAMLGIAIAVMLLIWPDLRRKRNVEEKARLRHAIRDVSTQVKAIQIIYLAVIAGLSLSVLIRFLMNF